MSSQVCFAFRKDVYPDQLLSGRPEIFEKLRARGLDPVVSIDAEQAFSGGRVEIARLVGREEVVQKAGSVALHEDIKVIVNRVHRSLKLEDLPPMINENATRSLAFHKDRTDREVLHPLGLSMPTRLVSSGEDIDAFLAEQTAADFIVKPANGSHSKGVQAFARGQLHAAFADVPAMYGTQLVQPRYDLTVPFPDTVRPYDAQSQEAFAGWNVAGKTKELRMYGFHAAGETTVFPVARAIEDGDQWFFVDPDSLPDRVVEGTKDAMNRAAEVSGALAIYGTVDFGYGTANTEDPGWNAIEMNMRAPYMIGYDKHPDVADTLREQFADQIQIVAAIN